MAGDRVLKLEARQTSILARPAVALIQVDRRARVRDGPDLGQSFQRLMSVLTVADESAQKQSRKYTDSI